MQHAVNCRLTTLIRAANDFEERFPGFCRSCGATGGTVAFETHGFSYGPAERIPDLCGCLDDGRCPRCGGQVRDIEGEGYDAFKCLDDANCGWSDVPGSPSMPAPMREDADWWYCNCGAAQNPYAEEVA